MKCKIQRAFWCGGIGLLCLLGVFAKLPWGNAEGKKTFRYSVTSSITNLDPQKITYVREQTLVHHIWEGLVRSSEGGIVPGMAAGWEISPDQKTYCFHLREALWSDGTPVKAQDFVYGVQTLLDPQENNSYVFYARLLENGQAYVRGEIKDFSLVGIKALNSSTLEFRLARREPFFLSCLSLPFFFPRPCRYLQQGNVPYGESAKSIVSNGPFMVEEWEPGGRIVKLRKNPNYWNFQEVRLDGVECLTIPMLSEALEKFERGELDLCEIPSSEYVSYVDKGKGVLYLSGSTSWVSFNCRRRPGVPWSGNANFRRALGYAIDRNTCLSRVGENRDFPHCRYVFPFLNGVKRAYGDEYPLEFYPAQGDRKKAREYLALALKECGIGSPREVNLTFLVQNRGWHILFGEEIKRQLEATLGISCTLLKLSQEERKALREKGSFDILEAGWLADNNDPMSFLEIWRHHGFMKDHGYFNPRYEELLDSAIAAEKSKERMKFLFEAEKVLLGDAPLVPVALFRRAWAVNPELEDLRFPFFGVAYDFISAQFNEE